MNDEAVKRQIRLFQSPQHGWLAHDTSVETDTYLLKTGTQGRAVTLRFPEAESRTTLREMRTFLQENNLAETEASKMQEDTEYAIKRPQWNREMPWGEMSF